MTTYCDEENHTPLCYYLMLAGACLFGLLIWAWAIYGIVRFWQG